MSNAEIVRHTRMRKVRGRTGGDAGATVPTPGSIAPDLVAAPNSRGAVISSCRAKWSKIQGTHRRHHVLSVPPATKRTVALPPEARATKAAPSSAAGRRREPRQR